MKATMPRLSVACLSIAGWLGCAASAQATALFFTDETAFQAALGGAVPSVESFEGSEQNGGPIAFSAFSVDATAGSAVDTIPDVASTDGSEALLWRFESNVSGTITFTFAEAVTAFAVDMVDFASSGPNTLTMATDNGDSGVLFDAYEAGGSGEEEFIGMVSDAAFSVLTISFTDNNDWVYFDRAQFVQAVPAPAPLALFGLGLAALGLVRRRSTR